MTAPQSQPPPFFIEEAIEANRDAVWRAITDSKECRRWFGWLHDGLDAQIRGIFIDHATPVGSEQLQLEGDQLIRVHADGAGSLVRITHPSSLHSGEWDDRYDEVVQGWYRFLHQLRFYLERHPGQDRRTLFRAGSVVPAEIFAELDVVAPGEVWAQGNYQRSIAVDEAGGSLVSLVAAEPQESSRRTRGQLTISSYSQDDQSFDEFAATWTSWWSRHAHETTA